MEFEDSAVYWGELPQMWDIARKDAADARAVLFASIERAARGEAALPDHKQLIELRLLTDLADALASEMATFVRRRSQQ